MTQKLWPWLVSAGALALALHAARGDNHMKLPSFRGVCEVRSSLPGRMRLFAPSLAQNPRAAKAMREQMLKTGVVCDLTVNPRLSTALIIYDEKQANGAVIEGAIIKLLGLDEAINAKPVSKAEAGVKALTQGIDHAVLERTGGWLDGRTLASGALAGAALWRMSRMGAGIPGAMTLLWWACGIFRRNGNA